MELFDQLGPAIATQLADRRDSVPRQLCLGQDAAQRLAACLSGELGGRRAAVLFDVRTRQAAGAAVMDALAHAGFECSGQLVPDSHGHPPACDDVTLAELNGRVPEMDVVVGVGSGVISDLAKWLAFERDLPCAVFATAASMNGYAAANVAPAVDGVKTLVHARAHRVVAADPRVLAAAPKRLTSAGFGDVIAKCVSTADWRMNHLLFDEPFSEAIAGVVDHVESAYLDRPEGLANGDHAAVSGLLEALVYSGCAMTLQGSSLPASGGEHLISHSLDMRANAEGGQHDLHGRQVGLGTIFAAALYERVLALPQLPALRSAPLPLDRAGWGAIADSVARHHERQAVRMAEAARGLAQPGRWQRLRDTLLPGLRTAAWVKDKLQRAGAAHRIEHIGCDRERFTWAVLNGAQMRERFTSLDLAWVCGVLPDAADEIIDEYLA